MQEVWSAIGNEPPPLDLPLCSRGQPRPPGETGAEAPAANARAASGRDRREGAAFARLPPVRQLLDGCRSGPAELGAPALGSALEDVSVVQQTIEQRADRGVVAELLAPVVDRPVGGHDRAGLLVAPHDDF